MEITPQIVMEYVILVTSYQTSKMKEYKWALGIVRTIHDNGQVTEQIKTTGDKEINIYEAIFKVEQWLNAVKEKLGKPTKDNLRFHDFGKK